MNSPGKHIIRQQHVDVTFTGSVSEGQPLQQKVSALCVQYLMPALENILDRFSPSQGHIFIDRLELDLGEIQLEELEERLVNVFNEKMEVLIKESTIHVAPLTEDSWPDSSLNRAHFMDQDTVNIQAFLHFLNTGRLPWNYQLPQNKSLDQVLSEMLRSSAREAIVSQIQQSIQYPHFRQRLAIQFSSHVIEEILQSLAPMLVIEMRLLFDIYSGVEFVIIREKIAETLLDMISAGNASTSPELILENALILLSSDSYIPVKAVTQKVLEKAKENQVYVSVSSTIKAHAIKDKSLGPQPSAPQHLAETEGIYINNAGLILLHPFLPALFEATSILVENTVVDPNRALQLLHYISTGHLETPEYELTFSKIICGIPVETPVSSGTPLYPADIEEADALLDAVIRHWTALQNTSRDGMRGAFLLRPGKLSTAFDGGWLLQVERQSFDVLLDNLPWGYGIVKLPWLQYHIHVEW